MIIAISTALGPPVLINSDAPEDPSTKALLKAVRPQVSVTGLLGELKVNPDGTSSLKPSAFALIGLIAAIMLAMVVFS